MLERKMPAIKKSWPRVRASKNGFGLECWVVDLRPVGKRRYYPRLKILKALSKRQILDAQVAFNLLKGTKVTLREVVLRLPRPASFE
jgi:hypothetical protein